MSSNITKVIHEPQPKKMNCRERLNAEIHDECLILLGKVVQRMNTYIEYGQIKWSKKSLQLGCLFQAEQEADH